MSTREPRNPPDQSKQRGVPDTLTIPGQRGKIVSKGFKKRPPGPVNKIGRKRP